MQLPPTAFPTLLITFLFLTLTQPAHSATDMQNCAKHAGPDYFAAINSFCSKPDLVAPSSYANNGVVVGNAKVKVASKCTPPQWIPPYWCKAQFFSMCASAGDRAHEGIMRQYGKAKCQIFEIVSKASGSFLGA